MTRKLTNKQLAVALFAITRDVAEHKLAAVIKVYVNFLARTHKLRQVQRIITEFEHYVDQQAGVQEICVTTAHAWSEKNLSTLRAIFGDKIREKVVVNAGILGGMKMRIGDKIFDTSIKTQLNNLTKILAN